MFDSRMGDVHGKPQGEGDGVSSERYQVTVYRDGRPVVRGWWGSLATAERKYAGWIGQHEGARVVLTDELEGRVIHRWPDEM